ncbi:hypothetical protein BGP_5265 [Beggiatoa sp. PS]|nr:hypothetical protein BGP_5265 [Beggiatoa sp. PS]
MMEQFEGPDNRLLEEYKHLFKAYNKLLKQTKRLVKMSDKQQHQLTHLAEGLQSNNIELQHKAQVAEQAVEANEKKLAQFLEARSHRRVCDRCQRFPLLMPIKQPKKFSVTA